MKIFFLLFLLLTSCGYRFGTGPLPKQYTTISVPFAEGDFDGNFTAEIIQELASCGAFKYQNTGGDLILKVVILDFDDENIGFRYHRSKKGKLTHSIVPAETRLCALTEVTVIDASSGVCVLGPYRLSASVDFDHEYYSSRHGINIFSLGQLSDYDAAYDAAKKPLYTVLAQKIVDFVVNSW